MPSRNQHEAEDKQTAYILLLSFLTYLLFDPEEKTEIGPCRSHMLSVVSCRRETWLLTVPGKSIQIDDTGEDNKDLVIDKLTGGWIQFHNEELHNLYSAPNIIRAIKSRSG
jgi:hypothetical protein